MSDEEFDDPRPRQFVVMWDMYGLECVVPVPNQADITFALLKNEKPPELPNVLHMSLRARYNTQRQYEIYIVTADPSIGEDDLRYMFEVDPQHAADLIRQRGHCYYSDRQDKTRIAIT